MHITHLVETLHRGGLERMVLDLVDEQTRAGHACQVICLYEAGQLAPELVAMGVSAHSCDKRNGFDLRALWRLRRLLRSHRSEVVHTHNVVCNYYAALALTGWRHPRIVNTRHGMGAPVRSGRQQRLYRRSLRRSAAVVTVCDRARDRFVADTLMPADKIVSVPNGIRLERFVPRSAADRTRMVQQLGLPAGTRLVASVGRLNRVKDPATLVRAFDLLHRRLPDTALVLVGEGPLRPTIEALVAKLGLDARVRLLGDRGDVPALLGCFDLFAMASLTEGYSIALLEACAAGLPVVATAVGGNAEIVRDGVNGRVVPAANPQALATAMAEILVDPEQAVAMGEAGRRWVCEHGSLATMVSHYQRIYQQCR